VEGYELYRQRGGVRSWLVLLAVVLGALLLAGPAGATTATGATGRQACDPVYGCPPTSPPPSASVHCSVSTAAAHPGDVVLVTVTNVAVGTELSVAIDGVVVAKSVATADGQGTQTAAALAPAGHLSARQAQTGGAVIKFTVPAWLSPGSHSLVVFGAGVSCTPSPSGFQVLGEQMVNELPRSDVAGVLGRSDSRSGGVLALTGMWIALLLAIALVLMIIGAYLIREARRRRKARAREANRLTV
jgi:hypothetical protein